MSRKRASHLLLTSPESRIGSYLVRDSISKSDDYVLCVKEDDSRVSHYIISKVSRVNHTDKVDNGQRKVHFTHNSPAGKTGMKFQADSVHFVIGDHNFTTLASLLAFYHVHSLDRTLLIAPLAGAISNNNRHQNPPADKTIDRSLQNVFNVTTSIDSGNDDSTSSSRPSSEESEACSVFRSPASELFTVIGLYDFSGKDDEDLPFSRGERLSVLRKDEDLWWTAVNGAGKTGSIPVPYVERINADDDATAAADLADRSGLRNLHPLT